jgi:SAM-dependent methyltransferase
MINFNREYWENRGKRKYYYRGEDFYTITPIPYYYQRRKALLRLLDKELYNFKEKSGTISILDFGCGDGFFSIYSKKFLPHCTVRGYDIAHSMIRRAREKRNSHNVSGIHFSTKYPRKVKFDLIYIFAVFAHLKNSQVHYLIKHLPKLLKKNGKILLFEATGNQPFKGSKWFRRTENEYIEIFRKNQLAVKNKKTIIFPFYNKCRYRIIKPITRLFFRSEILIANNNVLFRLTNEFFLLFSNLLDNFFKGDDGNTFFVFDKISDK